MLMKFSRCDSSNHEVLSLCAPPEVRLAGGNDIGKYYMTSSLNLDPLNNNLPPLGGQNISSPTSSLNLYPLNNNWPPLGGQNVSSPTLAQATCSNLHLAEEPEGRECSPACICAPGAVILAHNSTSLLSLSIVINQVVIFQSVL